MSNAVIDVLEGLSPTRGPIKATCTWLLNADPAEIAAVSKALARGNTHTSVAKAMKKAGAFVTIPGIRDHWLSDEACETCHISLKS